MRVIIATVPHPSHFYTLVPYAQALQNAGHEVVVAAPPGAEPALIAAGLTAVSIGVPTPLTPENLEKVGAPDLEKMDRFADAFGFDDLTRDRWDSFYQFFAFNNRMSIPTEPHPALDGLVDFAKSWQPDLVLWENWFNFGAIMARACGAAHGRILISPDYGAWSIELFAERGAEVAAIGGNPIVEDLEPVARRYGLEVDEDLLLGQLTIDPLPRELRMSQHITATPVRAIPWNGGAQKPEWLFGRPEKRRVALTLGLSNRLWQVDGDPRLPKLLAAVGELDVEVIATVTETQLKQVERVPDNVKVVEYVPLIQLLPTCDAIISHGATGTFWAAHSAGIPQIVLDTDEKHRMIWSRDGDNVSVKNADRHGDSWVCAKYMTDHNAGIRVNHQTETVEEIRAKIDALLTDPTYREGAAALHKAWLDRPSPAELIPELVQLVERHNARHQ
jgi:UDP:flavonoid glycosyltransferase YjiC (YdhE family)